MAEHSSVVTDLVAVDKTQASLKRATEGMKQYAASAQASIASVASKFVGLGAVFTGAVGYLSGAAANKMLDTAKAAKILGTSVEQMQVITVAAKKGPEELTGALSHLMMQLGQARQGSVQAAQALAGAGLSMKTMAGGTAQQALQEIIRGLGGIKDPAVRAAESMEIFGREGYQSMAALLAGGPGALDAAQKKIADQGSGFKTDDVERIKKAKEAFGALKESMEALGVTVAVRVAVPIEKLSRGLTELIGKGNQIVKQKLGSAFAEDKAGWVGWIASSMSILDTVGTVAAAGVGAKWGIAAGKAFAKNFIPLAAAAAAGYQIAEDAQSVAETLASKMIAERLGATATKAPLPRFPEPPPSPMRNRPQVMSREEGQALAGIEPSKLEKFRDGLAKLDQAAKAGAVSQLQYSAKFLELRSALDMSLSPMERYREKWQEIVQKWKEGRMTEGGFAEAARELNTSTFQVGRLEEYQQQWAKLIAEWRDGTRTAQSLKEAGKELTEQKFGPLMTQNLGDKLKEKLAHIQEDFQAGFGRGLTGRAAEKEYRERANAAMRETGGFGKTDQEIAKDAAESAGLARAAGRPGAAEKIEADALRDQVQRIKERADRRAGLLGPHADLATAEERARAGIASIVEQRREGGFGQGPDADRLARRAVLAQLQPIANAQQGFQAHFEGLQDSWKRAQASAASSNTPEEKMVKAIDKLAPLLEAIGVNTENLKGEVKVVMKPVMTD